MILRIIKTGRVLRREGVPLVDLFSTGGSPNPENWECFALKVRQHDAEQIIAAFAVAEAARAYAATAAGIDGTDEWRALLAALKEMGEDNADS